MLLCIELCGLQLTLRGLKRNDRIDFLVDVMEARWGRD